MKRLLVLGLLSLLVVTIGCSSASLEARDDQSEPADSTIMTGDDHMGQVEITEREKELLAAVYPNESQIREGILFEYQKAGLEMLRIGENYLKEKYPGYQMSILTFEPANKFYPWAVLHFQTEDSPICKAYVTPTEGEYLCTDTFYAVLLQPAYDKMVEELLAQKGFQVHALTAFPNPVGEELGEQATVDDLLTLFPKLQRHTKLFTRGEKDQTTADAIEMTLREANLYGAYTLFFTGDADGDAEELEAELSQYARLSFNCFGES